jgi:hypothetical protein
MVSQWEQRIAFGIVAGAASTRDIVARCREAQDLPLVIHLCRGCQFAFSPQRTGSAACHECFLSRCRRGRAYVCGAYVCDFCGGAGVTLNTAIQTRAETKRHREGDTSALE